MQFIRLFTETENTLLLKKERMRYYKFSFHKELHMK